MVTQQAIESIEVATHLRGWIVQSFAQVEFMLGHFIRQCSKVDEYKYLSENPPRPFDKRIKRVREICQIEGPFIPYRHGIIQLIDQIAQFENERHFLVHGWLEVFILGERQTLRLRRFNPQRPYNELFMNVDVEGLRSLEAQVNDCSKLAMSLFRILYRDFRLEMPDDD